MAIPPSRHFRQHQFLRGTVAVGLLVVCPLIGHAEEQSRPRESETARVVKVTDGDTIKVLRDGEEVTIRLEGVDCPERGEAFDRAGRCWRLSLQPACRGQGPT